MTENPNTDEWEEYSRKEILYAVNAVIVDAHGFEDGFRAGMEHGALSVLDRLTGEEWVAEELDNASMSESDNTMDPLPDEMEDVDLGETLD